MVSVSLWTHNQESPNRKFIISTCSNHNIFSEKKQIKSKNHTFRTSRWPLLVQVVRAQPKGERSAFQKILSPLQSPPPPRLVILRTAFAEVLAMFPNPYPSYLIYFLFSIFPWPGISRERNRSWKCGSVRSTGRFFQAACAASRLPPWSYTYLGVTSSKKYCLQVI